MHDGKERKKRINKVDEQNEIFMFGFLEFDKGGRSNRVDVELE